MRQSRNPGDVISFAKLIRRFQAGDGKWYWEYECLGKGKNCINYGKMRDDHISKRQKDGKQLSCGCRHSDACKKGKGHYLYNGCGKVYGEFVSDIRYKARAKEREFDIDAVFLDEMLQKQNSLCALSGERLDLFPRSDPREETGSIDRIDSTKDYLKDNVWFVHKHINIMKKDLPLDKFLQYCFDIMRIKARVRTKENYTCISNTKNFKILEKTFQRNKKDKDVMAITVECSHGEIFIINHEDINNFNCYCENVSFTNQQKGNKNPNWTGALFTSGSVIAKAQEQAGRNKCSCTITAEEADKVYFEQKGICPFTNKKLTPMNASLIRTNTKLGFDYGNVRWVHKHIGYMQTRLTEELVFYWADKITKHVLQHCPVSVTIEII